MIAAGFLDDIRFCHRRRWPGRRESLSSRVIIVLVSCGLRTLLTYRLTHWWFVEHVERGRFRWAAVVISPALTFLVWLNKVTCKNDIHGKGQIAGGVCIADDGYVTYGAISMGAGSVIGSRTTIGMRLRDRGQPIIGRDVWIGSDCVVYGQITLGDGATLLPGTVVTRSIPPRAVAQGNPAKIIVRDFDNSCLREDPWADASAVVAAARSA